MKSLVRLRLYGNRFNILNIRPPKQLRDLSVANNQISILPNLDKQFPSLTNLSLGENPISSEVARNATFPKNLVSLYAYDFERNVISAFNFSALDNVLLSLILFLSVYNPSLASSAAFNDSKLFNELNDYFMNNKNAFYINLKSYAEQHLEKFQLENNHA